MARTSVTKKTKSLRAKKASNSYRKVQKQVVSKVDDMELPLSDIDKVFCERWLVHHNHNVAASEAGISKYSVEKGYGLVKFRQFEKYLSRQLQHNAQAIAKKFVLNQEDILQEMIAIGYANPKDYVEFTERTVGDKTIMIETLKPLHKLTRRQASAITNVQFLADGTVTYDLPEASKKHPYLKDLGQHLGMFHPKLIQEHIHAHRLVSLSFKTVSNDKIEKLENMFLKELGEEGYRMLGGIPGEFEQVSDVPDAD